MGKGLNGKIVIVEINNLSPAWGFETIAVSVGGDAGRRTHANIGTKPGQGTYDYPVRAMWNSVLAGIVFQHDSIEKLRQELMRNDQLREMCGFNNQIPPPWAYTRFLKKVLEQAVCMNEMFEQLVRQMREVLPDFGKHLAMDSKAIESFAASKNKNETPDGRRDIDADYGKKECRGVDEAGKAWEKIFKWFGHKLHLVVDATYELPVAFKVTKASASDIAEGHALLAQIKQKLPKILETAETLAADRGYDDTKLVVKLWDEHGIKPVIDIRNMWRDADKTRLMIGRDNVVYDFKGTVSCVCPETLSIMLAMALGRIKENQVEKMRSLVSSA